MSYEYKSDNLILSTLKVIVRSRIADILFVPFYSLAVGLGVIFRRVGIQFLPYSRKVGDLMGGQFVMRNYYEPLPERKVSYFEKVNYKSIKEQVKLYELYTLAYELNYKDFQNQVNAHLGSGIDRFNLENTTFHTIDSFVYFKFLLVNKPLNILEIGSGNSTKIALAYKRMMLNKGLVVNLVCVEPFEVLWLENSGEIDVKRSKVESTDIYKRATTFDLLFIDSSHVVKLGGDIEYIYTKLLPSLQSGTYVHIHDIFSPSAFPEKWRYNEVRLWAEQVIVDALVATDSLEHLFSLYSIKGEVLELSSNLNSEYIPSSAYFEKK
jgi:hypothetical protein